MAEVMHLSYLVLRTLACGAVVGSVVAAFGQVEQSYGPKEHQLTIRLY